ncbi:CGNR zinc finger domain-containing protein [Streptomyces flavofungini]|uniref:CGNR zinc finger domain-containing protein n=1 Tax=Streptomyces flavofungini TaxID=68200 RepID=A0ABS0XGX9_9ACTN|nr:CGNR zinc finger domain-containing protein [Streptomyces flavofungini]MBJ3812478.1 CGNR zinc finger domain-containing protein [Streptomyces flavofungini]
MPEPSESPAPRGRSASPSPEAARTAPTATLLTLGLAATVRHDGHGGVADDLDVPDGLTAWVRAHAGALPGALAAGRFRADQSALDAVRGVRAAVRALFAHAVRPGAPSPADARRLLPLGQAVARLNEAAAGVPTVPVLSWPRGAGPVVRDEPIAPGTSVACTDLLLAALARAALTFLTGPDRERLRACHAPRCVRYFLKDHPRQEWCRPACGNRARVARHHERNRGPG